jgi:transposase-like protein
MRRSPKVSEVLPILYLRGLSTGDFVPALEGFFGSDAGLSASTVTRLTQAWRAEHDRWSARDLSGVDYVYIWADGVYVNVRLPDTDGHADRLCLLVIVGVRPDGRFRATGCSSASPVSVTLLKADAGCAEASR